MSNDSYNELIDMVCNDIDKMLADVESSIEHYFELGFNKVYSKDNGKEIIVTPFEPEKPYRMTELKDRKAFDEACDCGDKFLKRLRIKSREELRKKLRNEYSGYNFSFDGFDNNCNSK